MELQLEKLKFVSLGLAIFGLICLAFLLPEEKIMQISEISAKDAGKKISVFGTIKNLKIKNTSAFFEIENVSKIKAVYFNPKIEQLSIIKENEKIKAAGIIEIFENNLELNLQKVETID